MAYSFNKITSKFMSILLDSNDMRYGSFFLTDPRTVLYIVVNSSQYHVESGLIQSNSKNIRNCFNQFCY